VKMKVRKYVSVYYDPDLKNWDEVIDQELKRLGLRHGQATVICRPSKHLKSVHSNETLRINCAD